MATCVVTGVAGFIGSTLAERLLAMGHQVRGVDCLGHSYDPLLKERNLAALCTKADFQFFRLDLVEAALEPVLEGADVVFHQAALAGVRGSWGDNFQNYLRNNVWATQRLLEALCGSGPGRSCWLPLHLFMAAPRARAHQAGGPWPRCRLTA